MYVSTGVTPVVVVALKIASGMPHKGSLRQRGYTSMPAQIMSYALTDAVCSDELQALAQV
jgi:hypothetical protein